jgi:hypothetical protein
MAAVNPMAAINNLTEDAEVEVVVAGVEEVRSRPAECQDHHFCRKNSMLPFRCTQIVRLTVLDCEN